MIRILLTLSLALAALLQLVLTADTACAQEQKRISAHLDNEIIPLTSSASTVGGFLEELSILLPESGAFVDPPSDAALKDGMNVFLSGFMVTRGNFEREVPVETEIIEEWHFGPEQVELISSGRSGKEEVQLTIFYNGDEEVGRRERAKLIQRMKPRTVVYKRSLDCGVAGPSVEDILEKRVKPGNSAVPPQQYVERLTMESSAYEPGPHSCGPFASGRTSCGLEAGYGVVAVDPDYIPLGTRLFIEGYGYAVAGDVGGAIKGYKIDLGFLTVDECYSWGRRDVEVYILH